MNPALYAAGGTIVVGLLAFFGGRLASRDARKATQEATAVTARIEERKVDLEYFNVVQQRNEAAIARLDNDLDEERAARRDAERAAEVAKRDAARALRRVTRRVGQLEQAMRDGGMSVPPPLADPDDL